jgi:hypothetical protein
MEILGQRPTLEETHNVGIADLHLARINISMVKTLMIMFNSFFFDLTYQLHTSSIKPIKA